MYIIKEVRLMSCNTFYEYQCCTSCFDSTWSKILNAPRINMHCERKKRIPASWRFLSMMRLLQVRQFLKTMPLYFLIATNYGTASNADEEADKTSQGTSSGVGKVTMYGQFRFRFIQDTTMLNCLVKIMNKDISRTRDKNLPLEEGYLFLCLILTVWLFLLAWSSGGVVVKPLVCGSRGPGFDSRTLRYELGDWFYPASKSR